MILKGAITGTPRSGTTIFSAMLNQHPDLYVPFQSPLVELLWRQYELYTDRNFSIELSSVEVRQGMSQFFRLLVPGSTLAIIVVLFPTFHSGIRSLG